MGAYTYPGVYIQELESPVHTIASVATSVTAFVGYTKSGIDNRAEHLYSFADFERTFGGFASDSELSYAVQQFFQNGGSEAYVVRVPKHGATDATAVFEGITLTALSSGTWANGNLIADVNYDSVDQTAVPTGFNLTITNLIDGTVETFSGLSLDPVRKDFAPNVVNDPDSGSQLVKVSVHSPAPTVAPARTGLTGSAITAAGILGSAAKKLPVTGTFAVVKDGATATASNPLNLQALRVGQFLSFDGDATNGVYAVSKLDSATGAVTLAPPFTGNDNPTAVGKILQPVANGNYALSLGVSSPATLAPLPLNITVFADGNTIPQSLPGVAQALARALNTTLQSKLPGSAARVTVTKSGSGSGLRVVVTLPQNPDAVITLGTPTGGLNDASALLGLGTTANVAQYSLGTAHVFGSQTASVAGGDGTGLPQTGDLIGSQSDFTGIYALEKVDLFNLLSIPDATRANPGDPASLDSNIDTNAIYSAAIALCDERRAFLLIDPPPNVNTPAAAVDWVSTQLNVQDRNAAAFFPRLRLPDPLNDFQLRTFAPSGVASGVYARTDASRGVWKAPAGIDAQLIGVQSMAYKLSDAENGSLNPLGLNCFRNFPVYGSVLWGARTTLGADARANEWKYVPVRRLALFLEESLFRGTQWVVFEPNDEPLWASIRLNVEGFLNTLFRRGAFQGKTPQEAYFVKCDSTTTTQTDIDSGVVNILVGFAPLKPAEFVVIQIQQISSQSVS
ncbi:phage tail sheath family protein [Terriglobus roseus]|uniref:Tail sheath protein C-terminal domain-containing protein n=1 Tax=Terriglobus roseus TaxID=392734 RepID=A0A1H4IYH6_9BACT|nr:phage tail sheath C-terminal domain-containing protein [Terriglobus roseus]SEB38895.1 hypothetical protein SAMN05443244_0190 [Terriglobus roseus]